MFKKFVITGAIYLTMITAVNVVDLAQYMINEKKRKKEEERKREDMKKREYEIIDVAYREVES